jgi:4'-phosphopantetheinyl transferase
MHTLPIFNSQLDDNIKKLEFAGADVYVMDNILSIPLFEVQRLFDTLPKWRQKKILTFRKESDRRESLFSFLLLKEVLRNVFGITEDLVFDYSEHGKPFLVGHPNIHFNISHCKEAVACAVGLSEIGIDIERRGRFKKIFAQHVMNETEMKLITEHQNPDLAFTVLWTKKEALLKMKGVGVSGNMREVLKDKLQYHIETFDTPLYVCSIATQKKGSE